MVDSEKYFEDFFSFVWAPVHGKINSSAKPYLTMAKALLRYLDTT